MNAQPGTYAIIFKNNCKKHIQIGHRHQIKIEPGYFIYIGSACGKGGVRARVLRHYRKIKRNHWHIDYLRKHMNPVTVWYTHDINRLEHKWACSFNKMSNITAIPRLGCSDCKCYSHLFYSSNMPDINRFRKTVDCEINAWSAIVAEYNPRT